MSSQLTPLVFNDIIDVFIFIFIMQITFNVRFFDPAFSRLLLGLLSDGRRKVALQSALRRPGSGVRRSTPRSR